MKETHGRKCTQTQDRPREPDTREPTGEIWMNNISTSSIKNAPTPETQPGAVPFKVARDVLDAIGRESPLHGIVAQALIAKGKMQVVDE